MRRTGKNAIPYSAYRSRIQTNEALDAARQGKGSAETLLNASNALRVTSSEVSESKAGLQYGSMASLVEALSRLVSWRDASRSAEVDADRYLRSAKLTAQELGRELNSEVGVEQFAAAAARIKALTDPDQIADLSAMLSCIPLPLPLFNRTGPRSPLRPSAPAEKEPRLIVVAFTSFEIDGKQFGDPQALQPEVIHDLTVKSSLSQWPPTATQLTLSPLSVEPGGAYELPTFHFDPPVGSPPYFLTKTGRMLVRFPTSVFARPLEFTYSAGFLPEDLDFQVSVQGQRRLRVECFDAARRSLSGYVEVDKRLLEIRDEARLVPAISEAELNEFLELLSCIGGIAGRSLQDNLFPRMYSESEFQKDITGLLRGYPQIGSELEEHPRAARGITDLSFRRFRIELKVEANRHIGIEDASDFLQQTAQYVAGSDRRFGVLCLLDCSEKTQAPGTVANDLALIRVDAPSGGLPICIGVIILRGNLPRPSSFSS
jgi:hypothetical protein